MPKPTPKIVGLCPDCELYIEPYEPGMDCPSDECPNKLRKRALYICELPDHCDEEGFDSYPKLQEHQREALEQETMNVLY